MIHPDIKLGDALDWQPTVQPGIDWAALSGDRAQGSTGLLRLARGARFPAQITSAGEGIYVVRGDLRIGVSRLRTGDWLGLPAGPIPDGQALLDSLLLVTIAPQ